MHIKVHDHGEEVNTENFTGHQREKIIKFGYFKKIYIYLCVNYCSITNVVSK